MDLSNQDDVPTCRICHCTESSSSSSNCSTTNAPPLTSTTPQPPTQTAGTTTSQQQQSLSSSSSSSTATSQHQATIITAQQQQLQQQSKLISPCHCSGSLKYVHHSCLQQWLDATNSQRCELCKHSFSMSVKYRPIYKWGSLNASPGERRRLICNSVFNLVSMVCIFWSIYVLIERASYDAKSGNIDWSFYVKISVVTIGLIIGVIFLFVQLKLYFSIFMKWRQSNRVIIIRNANFLDRNTSNNNQQQPQPSSSSGVTTTTRINSDQQQQQTLSSINDKLTMINSNLSNNNGSDSSGNDNNNIVFVDLVPSQPQQKDDSNATATTSTATGNPLEVNISV